MTKGKMRRDAVSPFRDKLWKLFEEQASGMDGADIVIALKQAGEEIWAVGIDDTYSSMKHQDDETLGNAGRRDLPMSIEYAAGLGPAARALARRLGPVRYVTPFDGPARNLSGARLLVIVGN